MPKRVCDPKKREDILKEVNTSSSSVAEIAKKYNVSSCVIYNWLRRGKSRRTSKLVAAKPANKIFDEVAFLKSELEKRDKIILQFALKHFGQNL